MEDGSRCKLKDPGVSMRKPSSSTTSLKRPRQPNNETKIAACLVDGCNSDLSKCRDYHRRHKVCELHSKTSKVTIKGQERRFCQQCSRFHSLVEFDEGKRSCRRRLDGHNKRRRKRQSESMSTNLGRFLSNYQGTRFLSFGNPQMCAANAVMNSPWGYALKPENDSVLLDNHSQLNETRRSSYTYREKQIPFVQGFEYAHSEASVYQPFTNANFALGNSSNSHRMFANGLYRDRESNCALSLLSWTRATQEEIGLSHTAQSSSVCPAQSMIPRIHYKNVGVQDEAAISNLVSDGNSIGNLHCQGKFQNSNYS
ncbi:teosinte glume architecture 1 [Pyrus x bretschneideri]|uniref:teosinte glume architecture 1 n=1 Tax=Pyrus x bretschneideri TaxID=225117 RepID=UPI00202F9FFC|nr:teosinte glume architecture 1 [Pyrus x bretschneideri]XP_048430615.1 teosinte glume architecture 1 [Pyrus x bretschneideri]XP_048430616.1 teosinte glume architecture 1 [Pyrus x bretschneideri]XP_048430617.1 teosinte glume architecture 1 [Pyrus x bretschneideri]XP_048430618.1 teosinte glume architecture 1 [Pyrus x bretschneideri]XP_048430619.1 teosinte glume architecture 1 [Pyrus x bretschneideri]XP_048430620.1 teosinte glume architecture 1 [Pyrus x bretschneideri]XP_048430621.1 teosinte g